MSLEAAVALADLIICYAARVLNIVFSIALGIGIHYAIRAARKDRRQ